MDRNLAPQDEPCYEPVLEKQVLGQDHGLPTVSIPVETDLPWASVVKDQRTFLKHTRIELVIALSQPPNRTHWPRDPAKTHSVHRSQAPHGSMNRGTVAKKLERLLTISTPWQTCRRLRPILFTADSLFLPGAAKRSGASSAAYELKIQRNRDFIANQEASRF